MQHILLRRGLQMLDQLHTKAIDRETSDVIVVAVDFLHETSSNHFLDAISASLVPVRQRHPRHQQNTFKQPLETMKRRKSPERRCTHIGVPVSTYASIIAGVRDENVTKVSSKK